MWEQIKPLVAQLSCSTGIVPAPRMAADRMDLSGDQQLFVEQITVLSNLGAASGRELVAAVQSQLVTCNCPL